MTRDELMERLAARLTLVPFDDHWEGPYDVAPTREKYVQFAGGGLSHVDYKEGGDRKLGFYDSEESSYDGLYLSLMDHINSVPGAKFLYWRIVPEADNGYGRKMVWRDFASAPEGPEVSVDLWVTYCRCVASSKEPE